MRRRLTRLVTVLALVLAGALGIAAATAHQGETPDVSFTLYPVGNHQHRWFQVEAEPGETVALTAGIASTGSESVPLRAFAVNAITAPNGGFTAGPEGEPLAGPALWVDYPAETFEVAPGTAHERDFTVTVPEGTPPGHYVAALLVRTEAELPLPGSEIFTQVLRSAIAIEITVPGPVTPGFALGDPAVVSDHTGQTLEIPIANTGNALVMPAGELSLTSADGREVFAAPIAMRAVYAGHGTVIQVPIAAPLPPGDYRVSLELTDPGTGATASLVDAPLTLPGSP